MGKGATCYQSGNSTVEEGLPRRDAGTARTKARSKSCAGKIDTQHLLSHQCLHLAGPDQKLRVKGATGKQFWKVSFLEHKQGREQVRRQTE